MSKRLLPFLIFCCLISSTLRGQNYFSSSTILTIAEEEGINEMNFDLNGGLIMMLADNDGVVGKYILDTGAPCTILNKRVTDTNLSVMGVSGKMGVEKGEIEVFKIGKTIFRKLKCLVLDISHIEKLKKTKIDGLIGHDILKDKELIFDYDNNVISFFSGVKIYDYKGSERVKRIPFKMKGHMPVVKVKIGNKKYKFGIDTGAEVNVMHNKKFEKLSTELYAGVSQDASIQSVNAKRVQVSSTNINEVKVGTEKYLDMRFVSTDISKFNEIYGTELDGLLGYSFLKERIHSIDFKNNELVIWE